MNSYPSDLNAQRPAIGAEAVPSRRRSTPRVMHVVRKLDIGGLEVALVQLIRGLGERGFEQGVCCMEERGALAEEIPADVPVWSCTEGRTRRWERPELKAVQVFRDYAPDVIHAENYGAWIDACMAWLLAGRPGRLAFTMHGWEQVHRMPRRQAFICRQLARITSGVTAVSRATAIAFSGETGIPPERLGVLSLGVDTEAFYPLRVEDRDPTDPVIFGCVARINPIKGHSVLLDAVEQLLHKDQTNFEVRIIGDGPLRRELEQHAHDRGLTNYVRFLGERRDIAEQLRLLDVFVLPSFREGRPLSIMEAAATGLPIVATCVGSVPELLGDGEIGITVSPGDPVELATAMASLCNDADLRRRLGAAAREQASERMSIHRMIDEHAAFYRRIAAGSTGTTGQTKA